MGALGAGEAVIAFLCRLGFLIVWSAVLFFPLGSLFVSTFREPAPEMWGREALEVAAWSLRQAGLSVVLSLGAGSVLGILLGARSPRIHPRALLALRTAWALPSVVPSVVLALVFLGWFGRSGPFGEWDLAYSGTGVLLAHALINIPFAAGRAFEARARVVPEFLEAARSLGARPWDRFWIVVTPAILPAIAQAGLQIFVWCLMSFAVVTLVGGGPPVETLESAIYSRVRFGEVELSSAARFAWVQLVLGILPTLALQWLRRGSDFAFETPARADQEPRSSAALTGLVMVLAVAGLAAWIPLFWGVSGFQGEWVRAFGQTLVLGFLGAGAAVLLGGTAVFATEGPRQQRLFQFLGELPSGLSPLVLSLACWLAWGTSVDLFDAGSGVSFSVLGLLIGIQGMPFVVRQWVPLRAQAPLAHLEAARSLGASPLQAWYRVEWPRLRAPFLATFALVFAGALGELSLVSFFGTETLEPMSLRIARALGHYRFEEARLFSLLLFLSAGGIALLGLRYGQSRTARSLPSEVLR